MESKGNVKPAAARSGMRTASVVLATVAVALAFVLALGALFPSIPLVGTVGAFAASFATLHVALLALLGTAAAARALSAGAGTFTRVIAALGVAATVGASIPLVALLRFAHEQGAPISWAEHLRIVAPGPAPRPGETTLYATIGGKPLYVDIYRPSRVERTGHSVPVVMIHGGGFAYGERSGGTARWDRWFAARGYTVFDIDYRLAPPVTWNQAAPDVACALTWIAAHADKYRIAADRPLLVGQSAGGSLTMQVAYGLADGKVESSCGGTAPRPRAVIALYPPDDLALAWRVDARIGPVGARKFNTTYIGGSPEEFPDRYRLVSAVLHIRPDSAPTLIAAGEHDHLVPFSGHVDAAARLTRAGVPNVLLGVPYGEHGYDAAWGGLGSQVTRHVVSHFLEKFTPATVAD